MGPLDIGDLRNFGKNASSTPATSFDNASPGNSGGMMIQHGRVIPIDAPQGWKRYGAGLIDWATFGISDLDKRGNLSNFGGSMHGNTGFGQSADGIRTDAKGNVVDTERDVSGKIIGTAKTKDELKAEKEKQDKIEAENRQEEHWNKRIDKLEGIAKRGQTRNMIAGGLTGMGESIMEGTKRGAQSLDQAQVATATMIANMPKLQLTAMKYAPQQNYGLG